ncbi:MAG: hypothetical protein ACRD0F_05050, partial [Acidimicrobiales bacterium]
MLARATMAAVQATGPEAERVAPATRILVVALLAAFAVCGVVGIEAWPLTGFRLFSQARTGEVVVWQAATVNGAGGERPIDFEALPRGFHGAHQVMA